MIKGLVSVITPTYNCGKFMAETIACIQAQTYGNWEMIIVDDGSTDDAKAVVDSYMKNDPRIRYHCLETNSGAAVARTKAMELAQGEYMAFCDSDDLWEPEKLEKQLAFMVENDYAFTYTDYSICLNGEWLPYVYTGPKVVNKRKMYDYCYFSTITVIYDVEKIGLVQIENLRKNNDYAMWLQIIEKSNCHRFPQRLSYYIKHDDSISGGSKLKLIKHHYILYRTGMKKDPLRATILTIRNLFFGVLKKLRYKEKLKPEDIVPKLPFIE